MNKIFFAFAMVWTEIFGAFIVLVFCLCNWTLGQLLSIRCSIF